ncbi:TPR-like protein [Linderina pennispora]|uniref:TPR-like protein n=1 Tax=Linderina pennispora TaxID=61395 RepID=A0A1Y1W0D2_9FUNG|nr:TPR-like protein [Linderina pennispora]ORX66971.1 TPR-like protein [Linderina pennispora]
MSGFSDLVGNGAECGPGNSMNGLMKQFNKDHSLEQDRFGPAQASSSKQAFRQAFRHNGPVQSPNMMANEFMMQQNRTQGPGAFNFAEMHRELNTVQGKQPAPADWAADFQRHQGPANADFERAFARAGPAPMVPAGPMQMRPMAAQQGWAEQFHHQPAASQAAAAPVQQEPVVRHDPMAMAFNEARMYSMMPGPGMMMHNMMPMQHQQQVGGTAQQTEVTAEQKQAASEPVERADDELARTAAKILDSVSDTANPKFRNSEFLSLMQQLADGQATINGDQVVQTEKGKQAETTAAQGPTWATEFEKRADELVNREATKGSEQTPQDGKIFSEEFARGMERNWAEEFESTLDGPLNETSVSGHPQDMDFKLEQPSNEFVHGEANKDWLEQFKDNIQPMLNEQDKEWLETQKEWESLNTMEPAYRATDPALNIYHFQRENYYSQMSPAELQNTLEHIRQNPQDASLADTIMALETSVTQNPQDAQAWLELGLKQQENEREESAIAALRKAIQLDPNGLDAHLALAVSYTNEGYQMDAYDELHEWIAHHDRYKSLIPATAPENMTSANTRKDYVQDLYIQAARMTPGQDWDPDVQVALGVLFNISTEYDKAIDCFKAALSKRPDDYVLWNRLGATLAHTNNNKEATGAYFRALELHPSFIRARYNIALASSNLGQHRESAENCLTALSLQQREMQTLDEKSREANLSGTGYRPESGMSATIWNALQLSMYLLGEPKLAEACDRQDLDAFRTKFDF